jgi:hypothetical protein
VVAAHADHVLLSTVDFLDTDLVCTHADHTGVVARTAAEIVVVDSPVDTRNFLRPTFTAGRLVLLVEPAAGGMLVPLRSPIRTSAAVVTDP